MTGWGKMRRDRLFDRSSVEKRFAAAEQKTTRFMCRTERLLHIQHRQRGGIFGQLFVDIPETTGGKRWFRRVSFCFDDHTPEAEVFSSHLTLELHVPVDISCEERARHDVFLMASSSERALRSTLNLYQSDSYNASVGSLIRLNEKLNELAGYVNPERGVFVGSGEELMLCMGILPKISQAVSLYMTSCSTQKDPVTSLIDSLSACIEKVLATTAHQKKSEGNPPATKLAM